MNPEHIPGVRHNKTEFERVRRFRGVDEPLWLNDARCQGMEAFLAVGYPAGDANGWAPAATADFQNTLFTLGRLPSDIGRLHETQPALASAARLVFINGHFVRAASAVEGLPEGAFAGPLVDALAAGIVDIESFFGRVAPCVGYPFIAMNTAMFIDTACLVIPSHASAKGPIHLQFISTGEADMLPAMSQPRLLLILGDGSRATVVEHHRGMQDVRYLTNAVAEVVIGDTAALDHYRFQQDGSSAYCVSAVCATVGQEGTYRLYTAGGGTMLARTDVNAVLTAAGSACEVTGLCVATGDRTVALHATIAHAAERCVSRQDFYGILGGRAAGIFRGRVVMREGVEPGDNQFAGRALVSPTATLSSMPASTVTVAPADAAAASVALGRDSLRSASVPELAGWADALVLKSLSS